MTGMADPFNRGTYPWGSENPETMAAFAALMGARRSQRGAQARTLRMGALSPEVFAVTRFDPETGETAALLLNRSEREQRVRFDPAQLNEGAGRRDAVSPAARDARDAHRRNRRNGGRLPCRRTAARSRRGSGSADAKTEYIGLKWQRHVKKEG